MYKIKQRSTKNIIGLKLTGKLTRDAYSQIVPLLEEKIHEFGKIRILIELDHWEGWGPFAALKDLSFVFRNSSKIERIAFIVNSKADKQAVLLDQPFSPWFRNNTRYFAGKEKASAWFWVEDGIIEREPTIGEITSSGRLRYGPNMNILIIGGSVSGMTLAALLEQRGFNPTIVEAQETLPFDPTMGILSPASTATLKALGLYRKAVKAASHFNHCQILNQNGDSLRDFQNQEIFAGLGECLALPKNDLLQIIKSRVNPNNINVGIRALKIEQTHKGVKVTFSDNSTRTFDSVICCDGATSRSRELIFGTPSPTYTGMSGWSFSCEPDINMPDIVQEFRADGKFIRLYPSNEEVYVTAAIQIEQNALNPKSNNLDTLREAFKDFPNPVPQILKQKIQHPDLWHGPFLSLQDDEWVEDRVALLGSAAFTFVPQTIIGSILNLLNLESAYVLAEELSRTDSHMLPTALSNYETRRRQRFQSIKAALTQFNFESFALSNYTNTQNVPNQDDLTHFWQSIHKELI